MHLFGSLVLALAAIGGSADAVLTIGTAASPSGLPRVVVIMEGCPGNCVCSAEITPQVHTGDACAGLQLIGVTVSSNGCCGGSRVPTCEEHPTGCVIGTLSYRLKLAGGNCTCTSMDVSTGGADAGQSQTGLGVGVLSQTFTLGGFGVYCDDAADGHSAEGSLTATCTAGGVPVPRTLINIDFLYLCAPCAG